MAGVIVPTTCASLNVRAVAALGLNASIAAQTAAESSASLFVGITLKGILCCKTEVAYPVPAAKALFKKFVKHLILIS